MFFFSQKEKFLLTHKFDPKKFTIRNNSFKNIKNNLNPIIPRNYTYGSC